MKPALLCLHGALNDKHQFDALAPLISSAFEVHTFNFDGHGDNYTAGAFTTEGFLKNVSDYISAHKLENVYLFGYSMGGYIALLYAATHPEKVNMVITLATKIKWGPEIANKETALLNPATMLEKVPEFAARLKNKHTAIGWQNVVNETAAFLNLLGENDYLDAQTLASIRCPVLITVGDKDKTVGPEECARAADIIPQAKTLVLPDTSHPFEKINPGFLASVILSNSMMGIEKQKL
jgi:pimeloyl-ACP methyl ester carboxylesterase